MRAPDIQAGRLADAEYTDNFADAQPPLSEAQALVAAERCLYCYAAPCVTACPTGIDVPSFIRRIGEGNVRGAAKAILEANVFGGMCARVCPTEMLCEDACVRRIDGSTPVEIGRLQRYATDAYFAAPGAPLFRRAPATGRRIAVVGAGPAGLACAHRLAVLGHDVVVFEAKSKSGGLNEYGIAAYKTLDGFAQREVDWLLAIGGIEVRHGAVLGETLALPDLTADYDAVFLALGLGGVHALDLAGEDALGVDDAVAFISRVRQAPHFGAVPVGRRVIVIGGGMTAVDAAVQAKKLGAEEVAIVYRRDQQRMSASRDEQDWAQLHGVTLRTWSVLDAFHTESGAITGATFRRVHEVDGKLSDTGDTWTLEADSVLKAIGQSLVVVDPHCAALAMRAGRIAVDDEGRTSLPKVWAGGDCTFGGRDLTVEAVQHGVIAAHSIDRTLGGGGGTPAGSRPTRATLVRT